MKPFVAPLLPDAVLLGRCNAAGPWFVIRCGDDFWGEGGLEEGEADALGWIKRSGPDSQGIAKFMDLDEAATYARALRLAQQAAGLNWLSLALVVMGCQFLIAKQDLKVIP